MTEQVKLRRPIKDCSSLKVIFFRRRKCWIESRHLVSLSLGSRASIFFVWSSIPANDNTKLRPTVFSRAIGTPNSSHVLRKTCRSLAHDASDLLTIRKSSNKCNIPGIYNLKRAIHSRAELKQKHRFLSIDHTSKSSANCNQKGWPKSAERHFWYRP